LSVWARHTARKRKTPKLRALECGLCTGHHARISAQKVIMHLKSFLSGGQVCLRAPETKQKQKHFCGVVMLGEGSCWREFWHPSASNAANAHLSPAESWRKLCGFTHSEQHDEHGAAAKANSAKSLQCHPVKKGFLLRLKMRVSKQLKML
jgi:hypothetical protein